MHDSPIYIYIYILHENILKENQPLFTNLLFLLISKTILAEFRDLKLITLYVRERILQLFVECDLSNLCVYEFITKVFPQITHDDRLQRKCLLKK